MHLISSLDSHRKRQLFARRAQSVFLVTPQKGRFRVWLFWERERFSPTGPITWNRSMRQFLCFRFDKRNFESEKNKISRQFRHILVEKNAKKYWIQFRSIPHQNPWMRKYALKKHFLAFSPLNVSKLPINFNFLTRNFFYRPVEVNISQNTPPKSNFLGGPEKTTLNTTCFKKRESTVMRARETRSFW